MSLKGHLREIILGIALLVVVLWYFSPSAPPAVDSTPGEEEEEGDPLAALIRRLRESEQIGSVVQQAGSYEGSGRNLFDYGVVKPKGPTPEELAALEAARRKREEQERLAREEAERLRREAQERLNAQARREAQDAAARATPPPPPKPVPPPIDVKFIGVVGDPENKIAVFLDGKAYLFAKVGDVIKDHFRVRKISYDMLEMGFTDPQFEDESRVLPMGE